VGIKYARPRPTLYLFKMWEISAAFACFIGRSLEKICNNMVVIMIFRYLKYKNEIYGKNTQKF